MYTYRIFCKLSSCSKSIKYRAAYKRLFPGAVVYAVYDQFPVSDGRSASSDREGVAGRKLAFEVNVPSAHAAERFYLAVSKRVICELRIAAVVGMTKPVDATGIDFSFLNGNHFISASQLWRRFRYKFAVWLTYIEIQRLRAYDSAFSYIHQNGKRGGVENGSPILTGKAKFPAKCQPVLL